VTDGLGIYYDPTRPSRLEGLIAQPLTEGQRARAMALIARLKAAGLSKYNLGGAVPAHCRQATASWCRDRWRTMPRSAKGAGAVRTNLGLLQAVRAANPGAVILYKPHPDVEAGLRPGAVDATGLADMVLSRADPAALLARCRRSGR
jgi:capsular polysaccharide export protein